MERLKWLPHCNVQTHSGLYRPGVQHESGASKSELASMVRATSVLQSAVLRTSNDLWESAQPAYGLGNRTSLLAQPLPNGLPELLVTAGNNIGGSDSRGSRCIGEQSASCLLSICECARSLRVTTRPVYRNFLRTKRLIITSARVLE